MNSTKKSTGKSSINKKTLEQSKQITQIKSRQEMIAETAYHLSEKRGFIPGYEQQDWFEAERIIQVQYPQVQSLSPSQSSMQL